VGDVAFRDFVAQKRTRAVARTGCPSSATESPLRELVTRVVNGNDHSPRNFFQCFNFRCNVPRHRVHFGRTIELSSWDCLGSTVQARELLEEGGEGEQETPDAPRRPLQGSVKRHASNAYWAALRAANAHRRAAVVLVGKRSGPNNISNPLWSGPNNISNRH
jgi:hypothetical protein